jgi:hypothetical protein
LNRNKLRVAADTFKYAMCLKLPNPGWNISAFLTLGGFAVLSFSAILAQLGYGVMEPVIIELGKAAFYTGLGGAYQRADSANGGH